tara:strand:- start:291 stop:1154 length:864 start_codon:yes stop_codon:yes gene_type:complete
MSEQLKFIYDPVKEELIETKDIQPIPEIKTELNLTKSSNEKKKISTDKPTYFFDTVEGVNHVTNTLKTHENLKSDDAKLLNKEMKLGVLSHEIAGTKQLDHHDKSTYLSDPEQKRRILNISKLEKDLGYTNLENSPILQNNINTVKPKKTTPQINREKFLKAKADKEYQKNFDKEYGREAMNKHFLKKIYDNKKAGKAEYEDFQDYEIVSAEIMRDEAKKKLKEYKPVDITSIAKSINQLEQYRKDMQDLKRDDLRAKQKYESIINREDQDQYKGIGSILNLPRRIK